MLLSAFRADDLEMRDLTICALTEGSRFQGKTVAAAFGVLPSQVSRIRSRYREHGARGLVHQMGRPPLLSPTQLRQARTWAGQGLTHAEIGRKLGMSRSRISELLKQHGSRAPPTRPATPGPATPTAPAPPHPARTTSPPPRRRWRAGRTADHDGGQPAATAPGRGPTAPPASMGRRRRRDLAGGGADREDGGVPVGGDAGARLHRPDRRAGPAGGRDGAPAAGAGAPVDDLGILVCTQMSFTLGALTLEQTKHLTGADAGLLAGLTRLPSLRTWRERLAALADGCDRWRCRRLATRCSRSSSPRRRCTWPMTIWLSTRPSAGRAGPHRAAAAHQGTRRHLLCDLAGGRSRSPPGTLRAVLHPRPRWRR